MTENRLRAHDPTAAVDPTVLSTDWFGGNRNRQNEANVSNYKRRGARWMRRNINAYLVEHLNIILSPPYECLLPSQLKPGGASPAPSSSSRRAQDAGVQVLHSGRRD